MGDRRTLDRPRWRAKLRHRHDRAPAGSECAVDTLHQWIAAQRWTDAALADIERLDLIDFLRNTTTIDLAPQERLRLLAVALETLLLAGPYPRAWLAADRVYAAALRLSPRDPEVNVSRAITALTFAEATERGSEAYVRMLAAGRAAALLAIEQRPSDAPAYYVMGAIEYEASATSKAEALEWFERALQHDRTHHWAQLYRAHCLQDMERWREAVDAYDAVDPAYFVGARAWRYDLLREQRAWCLLQAGDHGRARDEFNALLDRYEAQPGLTRAQLLIHFEDAARGALRQELRQRVTSLLRVAGYTSAADDLEQDGP